MVLAVALVVVVAGGIVWWTTRASPRADAVAKLSALGAPLPGLPRAAGPVVTQPSCKAFEYCVSAALTWPAPTPPRTFAAVSGWVKSWAARNHLGRPVWSCSLNHTGLFGSETGRGCEAGFAPGPPAGTVVFVAVTFADPDVLRLDSAAPGANSMPPPPRLNGAVVASISAQVVDGVHPID